MEVELHPGEFLPGELELVAVAFDEAGNISEEDSVTVWIE